MFMELEYYHLSLTECVVTEEFNAPKCEILFDLSTLGGDKVRKFKLTICNHQANSPLYVWRDV